MTCDLKFTSVHFCRQEPLWTCCNVILKALHSPSDSSWKISENGQRFEKWDINQLDAQTGSVCWTFKVNFLLKRVDRTGFLGWWDQSATISYGSHANSAWTCRFWFLWRSPRPWKAIFEQATGFLPGWGWGVGGSWYSFKIATQKYERHQIIFTVNYLFCWVTGKIKCYFFKLYWT